MFAVVRPLAARLVHASGDRDPSRGAVALTIVALLVSALVAEAIGVHAIFGAFLLGAVIPHDSRLARTLTASLEHLVTILLLPAFFAFAGIRTEIGLLSGWEAWLVCGLIILVATAGKVGGTLLAGRATGLSWRDAAGSGRAHEHARPDAADRAQRRPGPRRDLADAVHDDGADGAGDDDRDDADSAEARARSAKRLSSASMVLPRFVRIVARTQ